MTQLLKDISTIAAFTIFFLMFRLNETRIAKLTIEEQLDQSQIAKLTADELILEDRTNKLASIYDPKLRIAIDKFTEIIKQDDEYLKDFMNNVDKPHRP